LADPSVLHAPENITKIAVRKPARNKHPMCCHVCQSVRMVCEQLTKAW
jgi:hypothetical protein